MKKLLGIVVLGLLWCNTAQAMSCFGYEDISQYHNCEGSVVYENGSKYFGNWVGGKQHGKGTYLYANGDKYVGEWKNNKRHGYGTYTNSDEDKYVGEWINDKIEGFGVWTWVNGDEYVGKHKDNKMNGYGTLTRVSGSKYSGMWKNNRRNGHGTNTSANGDKYVGEFIDNFYEGQGTLTYADGKQEVGIWKKGKLVSQEEKTYASIKSTEKYYALVIGNNNYQYLQKLDAAENDAKVLADVLENNYGFEVTLLLNAGYDKTVNSMYALSRKLTKEDNLLIFYAGHGELDKKENEGYWLPVDASYENRSKWISNSFVSGQAKATDAKHVLLIVDSCFAGSLMRSVTKTKIYSNEKLDDEKYIKKLLMKKTRLVISSGGNEPVMDNDGGKHSYFALKLIETLKNNTGVLNTQIIFENIRKYVVSNTDQTPERKVLHKTGDDGGDFVFFAKN